MNPPRAGSIPFPLRPSINGPYGASLLKNQKAAYNPMLEEAKTRQTFVRNGRLTEEKSQE